MRFAQLGSHVVGVRRRGPVVFIPTASDLERGMQAGLRDAEVLRDLARRRLALASHGDDVSAELGGKRCRYEIDPSSKDESSRVRSQPNWGQTLPLPGAARRRPHHPISAPIAAAHRCHLALGQRHRDLSATLPRRLPLTATTPPRRPERPHRPWESPLSVNLG